jgi:hypothetical protein
MAQPGPVEQPRREHLGGDAAPEGKPGLVAELEVLAAVDPRPPGFGRRGPDPG